MRTSTDLLGELLAGIERELPAAVTLRRRLHESPELANAEHATAAALAAELPVASEQASGTGLLARVGAAELPAVAVRAELDGLALQEHTGASFSARHGVMHACGHDVHMAALVALARAAHELADALPAALVAVAQPSEEAYPSGAQSLARGELAAAAPGAVVAAHVHPDVSWGAVALDAGTVNASYDALHITVEGQATHGAYPHLGRDPVLALAEIVLALHAAAGRRIDPLHPAVVNVSVIEGAQAANAIPARARAEGALRAHRPEDRAALRELAHEVASGVASAHGCTARVELTEGEPALANDEAIVARARALLGRAQLSAAAPWRSCGSDDFAFFGEIAPIAMAFVGIDGAPGFSHRPLHHPELLVPDEAVGAVARTLAVLFAAAAQALAPDAAAAPAGT